MSYTLVERNHNVWTTDSNRVNRYEWRADCGHKHRTLGGAVRCEQEYSKNNSTLGYFGRIEDNSTGLVVSAEEQLQARAAIRGR